MPTRFDLPDELFASGLTPRALTTLVFALSREEGDRECLYAAAVAKGTGMGLHTARRALGELRDAGFATFSTGNENGRIQHRWTFHWPAYKAA